MFNKLAATFLWLYPLLFLIDGSISVVDDVASFFIQTRGLSAFRQTYAMVVYFLSIPYIFAIFFHRTKDWAPYWITVLYSITFSFLSLINISYLLNASSLFSAMALSFNPHYVYSNYPFYFAGQLLMSLTQVGVGVYSLNYTYKNRNEVERVQFRFLKASGINVLFISSFFVSNIIALVVTFSISAKGFIEIEGDKITSVEKIYEKDGKTIHLIPMIHVGSKKFYKELSSLEARKKTLILLEGVCDEKNLLKPLSYRTMASNIGLSSQEEHFRPKAELKSLQKNISYIISDVDASEFTPSTRHFVNKISEELNEGSFFDIMFSQTDFDGVPIDMNYLVVDIIEKRNQKVLKNLAANKDKFEEFFVPWGAAHLPEIEKELVKQGYKQSSSKRRSVASISEILKNM